MNTRTRSEEFSIENSSGTKQTACEFSDENSQACPSC